MFKHLLVPLDGSNLAEAVLPATRYLAQTLHAQVTLFHMIERNAPEAIHGEYHVKQPNEANAYLADVARTFAPGIPISHHVHIGEISDVAHSIVAHATELQVDLIVMCTHGQGGLRTWLFGNIAQKVIALGDKPLLLIYPTPAEIPPSFTCQRIVAPLDGNPAHEQGVQVAANVAQFYGAELHLLMVVPTLDTLSNEQSATARLLPGAAAALLDMTEQAAHSYLQQQVAHWASQTSRIASAVRRGDPAPIIVQEAQQIHADLIVLGTHGKSHLDAFWSGSTTPKVSSHSHLPLLLVPIHEQQVDH